MNSFNVHSTNPADLGSLANIPTDKLAEFCCQKWYLISMHNRMLKAMKEEYANRTWDTDLETHVFKFELNNEQVSITNNVNKRPPNITNDLIREVYQACENTNGFANDHPLRREELFTQILNLKRKENRIPRKAVKINKAKPRQTSSMFDNE